MPNGESKNWIRFLASLEGFYVTYGNWPVRMFVYPEFIEELKKMMQPGEFDRLQTKLELIPAPKATFLSEDDQGQSYDYGKQGFIRENTKPNAIDWLKVSWPNYED